MTSVSVTPLFGCEFGSPLCSLLRIDRFTILLDCGLARGISADTFIAPLRLVVNDLNAVVITHADYEHAGALPLLIAQLGLACPIYATSPVARLIPPALYDETQNAQEYGEAAMTVDDIDVVYNRVTQVKFTEELTLMHSDGAATLTVSAYGAGHSLGGAFFRFLFESVSVVYCTAYNHAKERHLSVGVLEMFPRPNVLIFDALTALAPQIKRKTRETQLTSEVHNVLARNGTVLIPVEPTTRVFELLLVLHSYWETAGLSAHWPLVFASRAAAKTVEFASQMIEWMNESAQSQLDSDRQNPFELRHLNFVSDDEQMSNVLRRPACILATNSSLHVSLGRTVLERVLGDPNSLVLFTTAPAPSSLASLIQSAGQSNVVSYERKRLVFLEGDELRAHYAAIKQKSTQAALETQKTIIAEADDDDDDDDDAMDDADADDVDGAVNAVTNGADDKTFFAPKYYMFPINDKRRAVDAYGETYHLNITQTHSQPPPSLPPRDDTASAMQIVKSESAAPRRPTKSVSETVSVVIACRVTTIDMSGRSDGASIRNILTNVAPRNLILIHGAADAKNSLANHMTAAQTKTFIPSDGQTIDIHSEKQFRAIIAPPLLRALRFVKVNDVEVAFAQCQLSVDYAAAITQRGHIGLPQLIPENLTHTAAHRQTNERSVVADHSAVFLGEYRFGDFKRALTAIGIESEFYGPILTDKANSMRIQKTANVIHIHANLSEKYFQTRQLLYSKYIQI